MSLVDRTNEDIGLALELPAGSLLHVDVDADSNIWPEPWLWVEFESSDPDVESRAWRITLAEAGLLHDRLGLILGRKVAA